MVDRWSYSRAGVDLGKHRNLHQLALSIFNELNKELGFTVKDVGGYTSTLSYSGAQLALHVDGVGTKTIVLKSLDSLWVAGWDCVAMNVNDVACGGVKPLAIVDYIAMPSADEAALRSVVEGAAKAARYANVAVLGGETAILPDLVSGIDVVCTVVGFRESSFTNLANVGDIAIGVESWGIHSNGYTLVRKILESNRLSYSDRIDGVDLREELAKPTAIYSKIVLEAIERSLITGAAHITGGAYTKIRRILRPTVNIILEVPKPPRIFEILQRLGNVSTDEMYRVFNMGIGLVLTAQPSSVDELASIVERHGFKVYKLGKVVEGAGKIIVKTYGGDVVEL
ncbi:MAG: phosphoribosylformylglycinamidine cyclo-ligase [Ignisphaera sp.]|nr:phosphoribosylformylglycinamidine cyclo-ligase [Ignisphaera sp.]MDW8084738.1 phosphoribosylformylglycinamidine cyclo-ligase [Ignisphaera sp.]